MVKNLLVEDKWLETLRTAVQAEIERVTQHMANRVKDLEERYAEPLPALLESLETGAFCITPRNVAIQIETLETY